VMRTNQKIGMAIALLGSIVAAAAAVGHVSIQVAVGIAVVCILIGTGVARGKFSGVSSSK